MIAIVTKFEKFVSKKGNSLVSLTIVDGAGAADKIILKDNDDPKFQFALTELSPDTDKAVLVWHRFEFDRRGYCIQIELM